MSEIKPVDSQSTLTIIDAEGNEKLCQILFTVDSEKFKKKYVVFYPIEDANEDEQIQLLAASYEEDGEGNGELHEVETDEEWKFLESAVQQFEDEMEECDCDEECEEECEEGHCCCHHHHDE